MSSRETPTGLRRRIQRVEIDRMFAHDFMSQSRWDPPAGGWIKSIRTALAMTARQLGRRIGVSQVSIAKAERAESEGRITLRTLRKVADGLGCDIAYALVPRSSLDMMLHDQANQAAHRIVDEITHGMALEAQSTADSTRAAQIDAVRERLIAEGSIQIWEQP